MIGVGAISGIYLKNITNVFKEVELVGVCDLIPERAEKGVQTVKEYIEAGAKAPVPKIYKDMYEACLLYTSCGFMQSFCSLRCYAVDCAASHAD